MADDLLQDNFCESVNINLIEKNITLLKIILVISSVYAAAETIRWYIVLTKISADLKDTTISFFYYRITPAIHVVVMLLNIMCYAWLVRGTALVKLSFYNNDAAIFNKGYDVIYKSAIITLIGFSIALANLFVSFIFL
jgi:hypothetical protein